LPAPSPLLTTAQIQTLAQNPEARTSYARRLQEFWWHHYSPAADDDDQDDDDDDDEEDDTEDEAEDEESDESDQYSSDVRWQNCSQKAFISLLLWRSITLIARFLA
jgi:hypothetical protein